MVKKSLIKNIVCECCGKTISESEIERHFGKHYNEDKNKKMANLAEFLSNELEYSPELIYDLLMKFAKQQNNYLKEKEGVK